MAINQLGDGSGDGVRIPGKVAFGSGDPVTPSSVTAIGTTTISQVATSGKWAFASSTAAIAFVAAVVSIQDKLDALGLVPEA